MLVCVLEAEMKKFKGLSVLLIILTLLLVKNGFSLDDKMFIDVGLGGIHGLNGLTNRSETEYESSKNESIFLTFKGGLVLNVFSLTARFEFYSFCENAMEAGFGFYLIKDKLNLSVGKGYIITDPEGVLFSTEQKSASKTYFSLNLSCKIVKSLWFEAGIRNKSGAYFSLFFHFIV